MSIRIVSMMGALSLLGVVFQTTLQAAEPLALAVVYDTSGSMRELVKTGSGQMSPKFLIGNEAVKKIVGQVDKFQKSVQPPVKIDFTLVTFGPNSGHPAIPLGKFEPEKVKAWATAFSQPNGATPLGAAIDFAAKSLTTSPHPSKHVLVITDGQNTAGPDPASVLRKLLKNPGTQSIMFHVVAFDIDANVFAPLKDAGATLVAAEDEKQLSEKIDFILEEKILLEAEEPKKK